MSLQYKVKQCESKDCTQLTIQEATGPFHFTNNTEGWGGNISTTSVSNVLMGTGSKSFTIGTGLSIIVGQPLLFTYDGSNYMSGTVTSYNAITGAVVVNITSVTGAGTYSSWVVTYTGGNPSISNVTSIIVVITDPNGETVTITGNSLDYGQYAFISNEDFGYSTNLPDGIYTVDTTMIISGTTYTFTQKFFSTCNIQCCIFKKLKDAKDKALGCDGCDEDITFELFTWARWKSLKFMASGCDLSGALTELTKLQALCGQNTDCGCS